MKDVYRTAVRTFLCACLLLGSVAVASAQAPTGQQAAPAPDATTDSKPLLSLTTPRISKLFQHLTTPRSTSETEAQTSPPQISKRTIVLT